MTVGRFVQKKLLIVGMVLGAGIISLSAQANLMQLNSGIPSGVTLSDQNHQIRIREVGVVPVKPDILYLLMKVTTERGQLSQAMEENQKKVDGFTDALKQLGIGESAIRLKNFVVLPPELGPGVSFSRNIVVGLDGLASKSAEEVTRLVAKVQDIGARYGSDCITCIGSG